MASGTSKIDVSISPVMDWRITSNTILKSISHIHSTGMLSDCVLRVGGPDDVQEFKAHKLFLAMASSVFEFMFTSDCVESTQGLVVITDISPPTFKILLEYIYTNQFQEKDFNQVVDVLYAAEKYLMMHLIHRCERIILKKINDDNVFECYKLSYFFNLDKLERRVLHYIQARGKQMIEKSNFLELNLPFVKIILDQPALNITEIELLKRVEMWYKNHMSNIEIDDPEQKEVYANDLRNELKSKICFRGMTGVEFAEYRDDCNLLAEDEKDQIFKAVVNNNKQKLPPTVSGSIRRYGMAKIYPQSKIQVFDWTSHKSAFTSIINSTKLKFSFMPDTTIFLAGVVINSMDPPFESKPNAKYVERLEIILLDSGHKIHKTSYVSEVKYGVPMYIYFKAPIPLKAQSYYEIHTVASERKKFRCINFRGNRISYKGVEFIFKPNINKEIETPCSPLTPVHGLMFTFK